MPFYNIVEMKFVFSLIFLLMSVNSIQAQNLPCPFDEKTLQFAGSPKVQARCLLRTVKPRGVLGTQLSTLPDTLNNLIGKKVKIKKENFRRYLQKRNISEKSIGGSLDEKLSSARLPNGDSIQANYFIIHDVSAPNYLLKPFPDNINEAQWSGNNLANWEKVKVAHVFVNRTGESITAVDFGSGLPEKRFGTKFALDKLKAEAKGLQIHIELVQPRRSDPNWFSGNDAIAPVEGFTDGQYERLALLYAGVSVRRGNWLIPAFHCATDAGIPDAHDDPQNFELKKFDLSLKMLLKEIS
jgi:hypothetical protein